MRLTQQSKQIYLNSSKKFFFLKKFFFYWFLKIKWSKFDKNFILNKMPITVLFFFLKNFKILKINDFSKIIFRWPIERLHDKITYLQFFWYFFYFSKKFFPFKKWWLSKSLMRLWNNGWIIKKLSQLRYKYLKLLLHWKKLKYTWKGHYYLSWYAYFDKANVQKIDAYRFRKQILFWITKKYYIFKWNLWKLKILKKKKLFILNWYLKINNFSFIKNVFIKRSFSWILSKKFNIIFMNLRLFKKLKKFDKFFWFFTIKKESYRWIFWFEYLVRHESLLFWKAIINKHTEIFIFLNEKGIFPYSLLKIKNFLFKKAKILLYREDVLGYVSLPKKYCYIQTKGGFGFLWKDFFEDLIYVFERFFDTQIVFLFKDVIYWFYDSYIQQWSYLPMKIWNSFENILLKMYLNQSDKDLITDPITSMINFHIFDKLFYFVFRFSLTQLLIIWTRYWNCITHCYEKYPLYPKKNWFLLKFWSIWYLNYKKEKLKLKRKINFFLKSDFLVTNSFFFKFFSKKFIKKEKKISIFYDSWNYLSFHRYPTPVFFMWTYAYWRLFFMRKVVKKKWFAYWRSSGVEKISYDVISDLLTTFWSDIFLFKTPVNRLMSYAFYHKQGMNSLKLTWDFSVTFKGKLKFKVSPNRLIKVGKKKFNWIRKYGSMFASSKVNDIFSTFFSFLTRTYLLHYMLHFGHTKATYNTTYKNFLIMVYNKRFIINLLAAQLNLKWNLWLVFKIFYLGGFVCLVSPFSLLLEGLVSLYGAYSKQPYSWYLWINGLVSNFDWIFWSIKVKIAKAYSGKVHFSKKSIRRLLRLWFCSKGILNNLTVDISFFPSIWTSYWVFLENNAWFYPTIGVSNTAAFLPVPFVDYYMVANDYSLLSLSFYINLILTSFKKAKLMWKLEFSVYPQRLLTEISLFQRLPIKSYLKLWETYRWTWLIFRFFRKPKFLFLEMNRDRLSVLLKYYFLNRTKNINEGWKHVYWKYLYFSKLFDWSFLYR